MIKYGAGDEKPCRIGRSLHEEVRGSEKVCRCEREEEAEMKQSMSSVSLNLTSLI